jgi:hypothetical protein
VSTLSLKRLETFGLSICVLYLLMLSWLKITHHQYIVGFLMTLLLLALSVNVRGVQISQRFYAQRLSHLKR